MRKVEQTNLLNGPGDDPGDCMRSAWASVLEIDSDQLPEWTAGQPWEIYWRNWKVFFRLKGYEIRKTSLMPPRWKVDREYFVATGPSPRTDLAKHCVVHSRENGFEWDPHPNASGLEEEPDFYEWLKPSKIRLDPLPKWEWGGFLNGKRKVPPIKAV